MTANGKPKTVRKPRKPKTPMSRMLDRARRVIDQCDDLDLPEPSTFGVSQDRPGAVFAELDHTGLLLWMLQAERFKIIEPTRLSDGSWPTTGNVAVELARGGVEWFVRTPRVTHNPLALTAGQP